MDKKRWGSALLELKAYRETDRKTKTAAKYGKCCNRQPYKNITGTEDGRGLCGPVVWGGPEASLQEDFRVGVEKQLGIL